MTFATTSQGRHQQKPHVKEWRVVREQTRRARLHGADIIEDVHPLVLLERTDGACGICGEDVNPLTFEIDHIQALTEGGEHSYANTQPAHKSCNRAKGPNRGGARG